MLARYTLSLLVLLATLPQAYSQCGPGEVEVTIQITTDDYGYETYWQLVPGTNPCGTSTIFEGGNLTIGCDGGGLQNQEMSGYGNNTVITEGPWCLTEGALYTIHMIDDWGDGQAAIDVFVDGANAAQFDFGEGAINTYTFTAQGPVARDMGVVALTTSLYPHVGEAVRVRGTVRSFGLETVNDFDLAYSIDGGSPVVMNVTGVSLNAGDDYEFIHDVPWEPTAEGTAELTVTVSNINGAEDLNGFNDQLGSEHVISAAIPDLGSEYLAAEPLVEVVANSDQDVLVPRDLAFHPDASRNELWVINKDTEASGGSTVTFYQAGTPDQTFEWRKDVNSWHFMSLPSGIAMGDNNCFATCPGVFDANHNGGDPFTGPTLWSADTAVYARYYGPLGSHLDMLHVNPNSQGIAHDFWNRYWVVDGFRGDIVMNDFRVDHGPGNDYHGNAIIRRYADFTITKDPNDHIVSHDVLDKATGWLYIVDHGGQRVLRMNTNSGTIAGPGVYGPFENYQEYSMVEGYDWEVIISEGLIEPAGIELVGTHLYVSDHANGDIVVYDITGSTFPELGRIHTGQSGLMGITAGPDGRLWGVNATTHEVMRMDPQDPTAIPAHAVEDIRCYPSPTNQFLTVSNPAFTGKGTSYLIRDMSGRVVTQGNLPGGTSAIDVSTMVDGAYLLDIIRGDGPRTLKFMVSH